MERRNSYRATESRQLPPPGGPLRFEVCRGNAVESRHLVHAVLSDAKGKILGEWGDGALPIFPRSAVKMIQAISWLRHPLLEDLRDEEVAIACASHQGEPRQVELVRGWLERLYIDPNLLECGVQEPSHKPSAEALILRQEKPCALHNNCSGKHAGILLGCRMLGFPLAGYSNYDHPYQDLQREIFQAFFGLDFTTLPWGIDGCSLPTYSVPLRTLALAQARLANPSGFDSPMQNAVKRARDAVSRHPYFLGGTASLCSQLVSGTGGLALTKVGAEGVYGASFPELGLGLALKCADGNGRATEVAMAYFLAHLRIAYTPSAEKYSLENLLHPQLTNWSGEKIGEIRLVF